MAVIIGALAPRTTVGASGVPNPGDAYGVHTLALGVRTFVYATGVNGDGISAFKLGASGSLTSIQTIADDRVLELNGAANFASVTVGGATYLYVNADIGDGISAFRVSAKGTLTNIQNIGNDAELELKGTEGKMAVAIVGGLTYLVATGDDDNGVSVFRVNDDGTLTNTYNVTDASAPELELDNAMDAVTAVVGDHTFICVAGEDDNGLSVFELLANGTLSNTWNVSDDATLNLAGAMGLATATVSGTTYLIASGGLDDGLSVFSLDASGHLAWQSNLSDDVSRGLDGVQGLTAFKLEGEVFVAASARTDSALSVFHLGSGGVLTEATSIFDNSNLALGDARYNTFAAVNGTPLLLGTSQAAGGISTFEIGGRADRLKGTSEADLLLGFGGNDSLNGGAGSDRLKGGAGNDKLQGGNGRDLLMGDQGNEDFIFTKTKESGPIGRRRDHIEDFRGKDEIVLRRIDADKTEKGNQAFELDHDGRFDAGEIRVKEFKKGVLLEINIDRDAKAEMSILLVDFHGKINDGDFDF